MKSKTILLLATASLLFGCSKGSNNNNGTDGVATTGVSGYNYTYSADQGEPTCTTNMHTPRSQQEYCELLRDDASNNNCARDQRYENFRSTCSTYTWNEGSDVQQRRPEPTHPQYRGNGR